MTFLKKTTRLIAFCVLSSITLSLSACWLPEKFDAELKVENSGATHFNYDGTLTYAMALAAEKEGELNAKDEKEIAGLSQKLKESKLFTSVDYLGKGRFKVQSKLQKKLGEPFYFLGKNGVNFFSVTTNPSNPKILHIKGVKITPKGLKQFKEIGAKVEGSFTVKLGGDIKVLKHNAQSEPKWWGFVGDYEWKIKSPDEQPMMDIKLP